MVSQPQVRSNRAEEQGETWLSLFEAACATLAREPDWKIESITVCSGLDNQTPLQLESLRTASVRLARQYLLEAEAALEGKHLAVRLVRPQQASGDRTPHVCDFATGHIRVIHAIPEVASS